MSSEFIDPQSPWIEIELPAGIRTGSEAYTAAKLIAARRWQCKVSDFDLVFEPTVSIPRRLKAQAVSPDAFVQYRKQCIKHTQRLLGFGLCCVIALAFVLVAPGHHQMTNRQVEIDKLQAKIKEQEIQRLNQSSDAVKAQSQKKQWEALKTTLEQDMNAYFDLVEKDNLIEAKLRSMVFDFSNRLAVLSYELRNSADLVQIQKALDTNTNGFNCALTETHAIDSGLSVMWRCKFDL